MECNQQHINGRPSSLYGNTSLNERHSVEIPEEKNKSTSNLEKSQNQELNGVSILRNSEEEEKELYIEDNEIRIANNINLTKPTTLKMLKSFKQDLSVKTNCDISVRRMSSTKQEIPKHPDSSYFVQFCRLCALPKENMVYIFSEPGLELGLRSKINTWLPTHVSRTDPLPKQVCDHCIEKLDFCNGFGKSCLKAEQKLNNMFNNKKFRYQVRLPEEDICRDKRMWKQNSQLKPIDSLSNTVNKQDNCTSQTSSSIINQTLKQSNISPTEIEHLTSGDDDSCNDLLSDDSSENELIDMILNDNEESGDKIAEETNAARCSFPCSRCDKIFSVDTDLNRHFMILHQNIKSARLLHICTNCGRRCASQRALESHVCIPVNSVPDQLACSICGRSFSTKARLVFHYRFHEPGNHSLECVPCSMVFAEEDNLFDHIRFSHRGESFICDKCGQHFNSKAALRGHVRSHCNLRHHKCEVCNKTFLDKQTLKEHSVSHMEIKPYQCHICGKYLNRNSRLKKHMMSHELQKKSKPQECYQCTVYRCEFCERCFDQPTHLNSHRANHIDETLPFKCHVCGTGFSTFARLATHKVTHGVYKKNDEFSIPKLFLCNECDKAYVHWTYLSVHRKMIHAEVKHMYKCKISLDTHKKNHNGPRSHVCPICKKGFVHNSGLSSHLRLHRGDKPHCCEYCGKTFLQRGDKDDHVRKHTGERPFACQQCPKTFRTRAMWFEHTR
ncbi:hypothetical protein C0J52_12551 [Blattella germanica]|nr:hypothetical protein C0J52_12551 [Blattella germanica]